MPARVGALQRLPEAVRLDRAYDPDALADDVAALADVAWRGKRAYASASAEAPTPDRAWACVPLRNQGGDPARTDPGGPGTVGFAATPYLDRAPYLRRLLDELPGSLRAARLLRLAPGARSPTHRDWPSGFGAGWLRLHAPLTTTPGATVTIDGHRHHWPSGSLWYGDFSRPHAVVNTGPVDRVHLVVDADVTPEITRLFPESFVAALPHEDVLYRRPEIPLRDPERFRCAIGLPDGQALFAIQPWRSRATAAATSGGCVAVIEPGGPGLRLGTTDGVEVGLVHVGDGRFRYVGWTDMHTLAIEPTARGTDVRWRFRCDGQQVDERCPLRTAPAPDVAGQVATGQVVARR